MRTWLIVVGIVLLVCGSIAWQWCQKAWYVPIKVVSVADKLHYADPSLLKAAVSEEVKRGFFGLRLKRMRDNLLQVPWVASVQVQRKWPNTVKLHIVERQPLAIWEGKGVIDTTGKLFYPKTLDKVAAVPEFSGDVTYIDAMVETHQLILEKIKPLGLAVKRLKIMPDHGWRAMLDNDVTIVLGQIELEDRLRRFVLAYGDQKSAIRKAHVIDLRYTNGLAAGG